MTQPLNTAEGERYVWLFVTCNKVYALCGRRVRRRWLGFHLSFPLCSCYFCCFVPFFLVFCLFVPFRAFVQFGRLGHTKCERGEPDDCFRYTLNGTRCQVYIITYDGLFRCSLFGQKPLLSNGCSWSKLLHGHAFSRAAEETLPELRTRCLSRMDADTQTQRAVPRNPCLPKNVFGYGDG